MTEPTKEPEWIQCPQSTLSRFTYDHKSKVLTIEYRSSGYQYQFFDVPASVFDEMQRTPFPGKVVTEIRLKYRYARVG